jgi:hypothetical protein
MASSDAHRNLPNGSALGAPGTMDPRLILLSHQDNVCVACTHLAAGEPVVIDGAAVSLADSIPLGHKLARRPIRAGDKLIKYGAPIGSATTDIAVGAHVHVHNLQSDYIPSFGMDGLESSAGGRGE